MYQLKASKAILLQNCP